MNVAREQGRSDLTLEIVDSATNCVDRETKPFRCGPGTSTTHHFQKNPGRVPIGQASDADLRVFLLRNAAFQQRTHTASLLPAKLWQNIVESTMCGWHAQGPIPEAPARSICLKNRLVEGY